MKLIIKAWNKSKLESREKSKAYLNSEILNWDKLAEENQLSRDSIDKRDEWLKELGEINQSERSAMKQKSRIKWAIEGDENSKFFHSTVNENFRNHLINGLNWNGTWIDNPDAVKATVFDHFSSRFKEPNKNRSLFKRNLFMKLDPDDNNFLESPFSLDEIKDAVCMLVITVLVGLSDVCIRYSLNYSPLD